MEDPIINCPSPDYGNHKEFKKFSECQSNINFEDLLQQNKNVIFLFKVPLKRNEPIEPIPGNQLWDSYHVKMPNNDQNIRNVKIPLYKVWSKYDTVVKPMWTIFSKPLNINSLTEFTKIVKSYNKNLNDFKFDVIENYLNQTPETIPILNSIKNLALELPNRINLLPLLKKGENKTIFMSRGQIASLLANAFFCTFPRRTRRNPEYQNFPIFNFASLFSSSSPNEEKLKTEKLKCLFNYFKQVTLTGGFVDSVVSFERRCLSDEGLTNWKESNKLFTYLKVENKGSIEEEGQGFSEVDFANKCVGGGVLSSGCLQEEIRFLICPELIASRLITENLDDNEAIIITGCAQYSTYQGYAQTFKYKGSYIENHNLDNLRRIQRQVVVIDALEFKREEKQTQYDMRSIERELNKAFCGFLDQNEYDNNMKPAISSGKWGCGAFNGDPYLKSLIQYMSAAETHRNLIIFTFDDKDLTNILIEFQSFVIKRGLTVGDIYIMMKENKYPSDSSVNYISFLMNKIHESESATLVAFD